MPLTAKDIVAILNLSGYILISFMNILPCPWSLRRWSIVQEWMLELSDRLRRPALNKWTTQNSYMLLVPVFVLTLLVGLGSRKGIRPVKTEWCGAGVVICLERGANLHMAQLMPLPLTVCRFSKIQICFTFLVPAYPGSPGKGPLNGCVCVCSCNILCPIIIL